MLYRIHDYNPSWYVDLSDFPVIELGGKEHREWFERISSQASLNAKPFDIIPTAFLDEKGGAIAFFEVLVLEDKLWLFTNLWNHKEIMEYLDFSHFGEEIYFRYLEGFQRYFFFSERVPDMAFEEEGCYFLGKKLWQGFEVLAFKASEVGAMEKKDFESLRYSLFQKGIPISGLDMTKDQMILEAPMDTYVTDEKGCYPGQETIAKVFTYKKVAKSFYRSFLEGNHQQLVGERVLLDEKPIGEAISSFLFHGNTYFWLRLTNSLVTKAKKQDKALKLSGESVELIENGS